MLFRKSFKTKIESANRVFTTTIEKLRGIQADMTAQIDKNQVKMQKLADDNTELEAMKLKAARQIEEISKFII